MVKIVTPPPRHYYTAHQQTLSLEERVNVLERQIDDIRDALAVALPMISAFAETASPEQRGRCGQLLKEHYRDEFAKNMVLLRIALEMLGQPEQ